MIAEHWLSHGRCHANVPIDVARTSEVVMEQVGKVMFEIINQSHKMAEALPLRDQCWSKSGIPIPSH